MRPGVKVKLWSPKFTNRPDVAPPGLLKLAGILSFLSVFGFLIFAVGAALNHHSPAANAQQISFVVVLHFALPLITFYTVSVNSPLSRWTIALYAISLFGATALGKGVLGNLASGTAYRIEIAISLLVIVLLWLFVSPKMRFYYAVLSGKPIPADLEGRADELQPRIFLGPRTRVAMGWFVDNAASIVMLGFIALMVLSCVSG